MVTNYEISDSFAEEYRDTEEKQSYPTLSFVIPVNSDPQVEQTVRSILDAGYDNCEIIVAITPTTGETMALLEDLQEETDLLEVYTQEEYRTPGGNRNRGIEEATGDVVVFADSDVTIGPLFPWKVAYLFEYSSVDYLGFSVDLEVQDGEKNLFNWYDKHVRFPVEFYMNYALFCPTLCLAVRDELVEDIQFEPWILSGEDMVFGKLAAYKNYEFGFCDDAVVKHPTRNTFEDIVGVGEKTGRGAYQMYAHLPVDVFETESRLLTAKAYTPRSFEYLSDICDDWDELQTYEKVLIWLVSYIEILARTWGYALQAKDDFKHRVTQ
ncbi:glycosyltransferase [Halorussus caseinilyticus]|uniref:Glycosyltransferase n=1 Tax=Halorussus caseinilyticus TaxID=3034025 RepID=A0ABD5WNA5_9EURY|nr:glycosyltransferase family A protein [Halorussus sp. DT72]